MATFASTSNTKEKESSIKFGQFELYDLKISVINPTNGPIYSGCKVGDYFTLCGEMLYLPEGQGWSIYNLSALLPLLAAKQRKTHVNDWMNTDSIIGNPDPNCSARFKIERIGRSVFSHGETTAVPLCQCRPANTPKPSTPQLSQEGTVFREAVDKQVRPLIRKEWPMSSIMRGGLDNIMPERLQVEWCNAALTEGGKEKNSQTASDTFEMTFEKMEEILKDWELKDRLAKPLWDIVLAIRPTKLDLLAKLQGEKAA